MSEVHALLLYGYIPMCEKQAVLQPNFLISVCERALPFFSRARDGVRVHVRKRIEGTYVEVEGAMAWCWWRRTWEKVVVWKSM